MSTSGPAQRRLFFALWPDPETRRAIVSRREALAGISRKRVPDHNLHLTLVFLGNVAAERVEPMMRRVDPLRRRRFTIRLDRFGLFPRAGVAWLGGEAPADGAALVDALSETAAAAGLSLDGRPWQPHVTLYRRVERPVSAAAPAPIDWPVRSFELIESISSRPYQVLRSWPLECKGVPDDSDPDA